MIQRLWARFGRRMRAVALGGGFAVVMVAIVTPLAGFANAQTSVCAATDVRCVITFGDARIAERQTALTRLNSRVTEMFTDGRITSADNAALVGDISTNESGLTALRGQLDSASDAAMARTDVKLIYTRFRIFAVVLPRDYHDLWLDMLVRTDTRLATSETVTQDAINGAPAGVQGQANTLFADYKAQVSTAQAQTQAAQPLIAQLTPASFNANPSVYKTTLSTVKTDIQTAHSATRQATSDLHQIVALLKGAAPASPAA